MVPGRGGGRVARLLSNRDWAHGYWERQMHGVAAVAMPPTPARSPRLTPAVAYRLLFLGRRAPPGLRLRSLTGRDLVGVFGIERHVALVAAGQHVERILDAGAISLFTQVDLAALECRGVFHRLHYPHEQR